MLIRSFDPLTCRAFGFSSGFGRWGLFKERIADLFEIRLGNRAEFGR